MIHPELLNDAALKKLLRIYPENSFLFKQGDKGNTMFILIEGTVSITQKTLTTVRMVDNLGPGDILGEKAILSEAPYRRGLTAQATSEVASLEFDQKSLQMVQSKLPNFILQMLRVVTQRLDRANDLISVLQLHNEMERLAQFIIFHARFHGTKGPQGYLFRLTNAQIQSNLNIGEHIIKDFLDLMIRNQAILRKDEDYILADESALIALISTAKERSAA